jgi:SAM-dependent methyltransferase
MSGFSAHWLGLREPVDHASRSLSVRKALIEALKNEHGKHLPNLRIMDLGCGSGSNVRALAPFLGRQQQWTLVDYDEALLGVARRALIDWADAVLEDDHPFLKIRVGALELSITFRLADLNTELADILREPVDLVTAAAFFDLVSASWIERFCKQLEAPLYAVLSYDGSSEWQPAHVLDGAVLAAFNAHQCTDKGFGPSAGPQAVRVLEQSLTAKGFSVVRATSPWQIEGQHGDLMRLLHQGIAQAVRETGVVSDPDLNDWLASRETLKSCVIGHQDLMAWPRGTA